MTYTLLVYQLIPEDTIFYLIPDNNITEEVRNWLNLAKNVCVNAVGQEPNDGTEFVNTASLKVESKGKNYGSPNIDQKWEAWLAPYVVTEFTNKQVSHFIQTSFIL